MPWWATLIITAAVTGTITWIVSNTLNALKQKSLKYKGMKKKEYEEMVSDIANKVAAETFQPLERKITVIEQDISKLKEGTQASLRNDLLKTYNHCNRQGYKTKEEMQDFVDMFDAYRKLDGNSFIVELNEEFKNIPLKDTFKK